MCSSTTPPAVPPPPPPPLPSQGFSINQFGSKIQKTATTKTHLAVSPEDELADAYLQWKTSKHSNQDDLNDVELDLYWYSWFLPTIPILQDGPVCGLVALAISAQSVFNNSLQVDELLEVAQNQGWTQKGEMFSAYNLALLAEKTSNFIAEVHSISSPKIILDHIASGHLALMPYDADKNHHPCNRRGHSAHWAVISGFCLRSQNPLPFNLPLIPSLPKLQHIPDSKTAIELLSFSSRCKNILVWARQGKSRRLMLWSLSSLIESNRNLCELADKHKESGFVLPPDGVVQGLYNLVVLLMPRR